VAPKISTITPRSRSVPRYADLGAAELAAENHTVPAVGLRHSLVEVRGGDGDMVDALALLGQEMRVDALLVERLDQLPLHLADRGDGKAPGALDRLDGFAPAGDVLELARGPGTWTPRLLRDAATLTAVDAAPEMLAIARKRVGDDDRVRFVVADTGRPTNSSKVLHRRPFVGG